MQVYDTLIIGSGYFSVGYAMNNKNVIIVEEHQTCDVNFYLPLKGYKYFPYTPTTPQGEKLFNHYKNYNLFANGMQNVNGFEGAFCKFIYENNVDVLIKTRVIRIDKTTDGIYDVTVQSNAGLTHIFAKNVLDTVNKSQKNGYTVLFFSDDIENDKKLLLSAFLGSEIEQAFFKDRFALHIPVDNVNENLIKLDVYNKWTALKTQSKILYMSPVFYSTNGSKPICDDYYNNPIQAFEAGYLYKGETL